MHSDPNSNLLSSPTSPSISSKNSSNNNNINPSIININNSSYNKNVNNNQELSSLIAMNASNERLLNLPLPNTNTTRGKKIIETLLNQSENVLKSPFKARRESDPVNHNSTLKPNELTKVCNNNIFIYK